MTEAREIRKLRRTVDPTAVQGSRRPGDPTHGLDLLAVAACEPADPAPPTPPIEWEGEWLRFGRSADLPPQCAGVAPYMDRYVGALAEQFEVNPTTTVDFFYVDDQTTPCEAIRLHP